MSSGDKKFIIELPLKVILTEAILFSIVAIIRIPVTDLLINISMLIAVVELVFYIEKNEKNIKLIAEE